MQLSSSFMLFHLFLFWQGQEFCLCDFFCLTSSAKTLSQVEQQMRKCFFLSVCVRRCSPHKSLLNKVFFSRPEHSLNCHLIFAPFRSPSYHCPCVLFRKFSFRVLFISTFGEEGNITHFCNHKLRFHKTFKATWFDLLRVKQNFKLQNCLTAVQSNRFGKCIFNERCPDPIVKK